MITNMKNQKKIVYVPMAADVVHHGHINIISKARELGEVVVGLYDDSLIANYKRVPMMDLEKRKLVVENIKGVDRIVIQSVTTFDDVLRDLRPDYVVHGDDWKTSPQKKMREHIIKIIYLM